jgi:SAM-dependent methyltransferase
MDEAVVRQIVEDWRLVTSPIRPDTARVALYRSTVKAASSALVLGATPELVDMLLTEEVGRVALIDLHAETIEAMRRLATRDWSGVETVVGDWRDPRPAWDSAFDRILSDGGLMFLEFPEDWRRALTLIHGYLRPGGRLVITSTGMSPTEAGFGHHYARAIADFERERPALTAEQEARRVAELASSLRGLARAGTVDHEGRVRLDAASAARRWIMDDLCRRYPEFERIIVANFGRSHPSGLNRGGVVAVPELPRVMAEMVGCGFGVEVLASIQQPARHSFTIAATRPR